MLRQAMVVLTILEEVIKEMQLIVLLEGFQEVVTLLPLGESWIMVADQLDPTLQDQSGILTKI
jgi:hypothetical protein